MRATSIEKIKELQLNVENIRNICILAHVDHGKTTLADNLIASNGIISERMAGKLRYMDSREDEQLRGITMKSSVISLSYAHDDNSEHLINLIDSPGHVDFSSEVCTAVRLCDGAVIVVDVVEGVCPQTQAVLRQAWLEKLTPVLVLNKIDRLIMELKYTPLEAHFHLQQILEQVNAVTGSLFSADVLQKNSQCFESNPQHAEDGEKTVYDWSSGLDETDDSKLYFSPDQGNVIFASATDGWGFQIQHFAKLFAEKLGIRENILRKTLWGDYYVNTKTKKILKGAQVKGKKPLFVHFILENLWSLYDSVMIRRDQEKSEKITKSLNLKISSRDVRIGKTEPKSYLHAICSQWLPLAKAVLSSICEHLPSPTDISEERIEGLMCGNTKSFSSLPHESQVLKKAFMECSKKSNSTIVLVSKMVSVDSKFLPQFKQRPLSLEELQARREAARLRLAQKNEEKEGKEKSELENATALVKTESNVVQAKTDDQRFIAFARVFSGTLHINQKIYVLGPKYDPAILSDSQDIDEKIAGNPHISEAIVSNLYLWMGKELENISEAPAGTIIGIEGLEEHVLNSATLCNTAACPPFNALSTDTSPIIRVAVDPANLSEMDNLMDGLRLLNQADPCVQVLVQDTGEHVIVAAGEVHLQRCLDDLRERFAKIKINASEPIVPFRETIIRRPKVDMMNELIGTQEKNMMAKWENKAQSGEDNLTEMAQVFNKKSNNSKHGVVSVFTPNKECLLTIRAIPLPVEVSKLLDEHSEVLKVLPQMEKFIKDLLTQRKRLQSTCSSVDTDRAEDDETKTNSEFVEGPGDSSQEAFVQKVLGQLKVKESSLESLRKLKVDLEEAFKKDGRRKWAGAVERIWAFGPRGNGPNILLNRISDYERPSIWSCINLSDQRSTQNQILGTYREFDHSIISGFQLAALSGPLCEEPLYGVCFCIEEWTFLPNERIVPSSASEDLKELSVASIGEDRKNRMPSHETSDRDQSVELSNNVGSVKTGSPDIRVEGHWYGPLSGQLISTCKDGCRKGFQSQPQRLMAAMYTCNIQATAEVLGKVYAVLGKREGRVLSEDLKDGSDTFIIEAALPVAESFGFAEEVRKRTSGLASPQLVFSHWEVVAGDPFWVPTTEEEIQHFGQKADFANQAAKYMNSVRRRKGLFVEEKTVEHAEKQRTLSKNK